MTDLERKNGGLRKICPQCGQLLKDTDLECTRCHSRKNKKFFYKLSEEDTRTIRSENLALNTPSSLAVEIIGSVEKDTTNLLEKDQSILRAYQLEEEERFNLLAFSSFCYFYAVRSFAKIKHEGALILMKQLREALLNEVTKLFCKQSAHPPTAQVLLERAKLLYETLEIFFREKESQANIPSQLKLANVLVAEVFSHDKPSLIRGLTLYDYFKLIQDSGAKFKKYFLVEDKDLS